ncbi:FAD-binding oxidoreductase [Segetibacter sp. 3557_3]|uniref:FAD-binding oxidoreductase n=1 Tax=Segetibacter sp. 3557_3 TaxID=2547429 RepID=UPI001058B1B7|nr:FAD-binding oxidoreductase [Segetibacter sp. 3557_3]TDH26381.1 FAD-binding oxidoreductase [Segetibacter sp. 3557_3]
METNTIISGGKVNHQLVHDFSQGLVGDLLLPADQGYHETRKIWNGMIDRHPALIARCKNAQDVIHSVNFAREHNLLLSVRGGGHNITGNAVCEGGIMIDLSLMKSVKVDSEDQIAVVETGATWGDFDAAAQRHGLATTGGVISATGVAGLTLGGGVGWLVRKHGLSCDNLIGAEVVSAEGVLLKASVDENSDLFWGIRGGGGNFGIVTSMKFRMHRVNTVLGGMIIHRRDHAKEVIQFHREFMKTAPEELTLYTGLMTSPDGLPVVAFVGCYTGDLKQGEAVLKPLREFGSPLADLMGPIPYTQMQTLLDAAAPHGNRYYWKSTFVEDLSDKSIDLIISNAAVMPSPFSLVLLEYYGGASSREPEGGTAFPHRLPQFDLVIGSNWVNREEDETHISWTRNFWEAMQPYSSHKVYVNVLGVEGEDRVKEAYGKNYSRLTALKSKYDPNNLFRLNQNIKPVAP